MSFRNGQWVKFQADVPGAHVAKDGLVVGIFQKGGTDGLGQPFPDRVMVVDNDGQNILYIKDGTIASVQFAPAEARGLVAVTDAADIPAKRMETARDGFVPKP
jgi:hypothetical protein